MNIQFLLEVTTNKLNTLQSDKELAFRNWEVERISDIETEIKQTQATIEKLQSVL